MIKTFRVKNLRAFRDSETIDINRLSILVGENSSGKSTLTRFLPLMRQSVEAKTRGPVLWYGDFADYGSFSGALSRAAKESRINLSVSADVHFSPSPNLTISEFEEYYLAPDENSTIPEEVNISVDLIEVEDETATSELIVNIGSNEIALKKGNALDPYWNFHINGNRITTKKFLLNDSVSNGLVPTISQAKENEKVSSRLKWKFGRSLNRTNYFDENEIKNTGIFRRFKRHFHGVSNDYKIINLLKGACVFDRKRVLSFLENRFDDQKTFKENLERKTDTVLSDALSVICLINIKKILHQTNSEVLRSLSEIRYIGPMRASAERYYRFKDLQVSELDPQGGNLVMLISSLSEEELDELKVWSLDNFGFKIEVEKLGDHYELKVQPDGSNHYTNVSDMGFGFSQVLPIVVGIWDAKRIKAKSSSFGFAFSPMDLRREGRVFIIEQPELHLHPKMQHALAITIAKLAGNAELNIKFLIETHSKTFIDGIGYALRKSSIAPEDVSVNIIERNNINSDESMKRRSEFNSRGQLINWPSGFFSPW